MGLLSYLMEIIAGKKPEEPKSVSEPVTVPEPVAAPEPAAAPVSYTHLTLPTN